MIYTIGKFKAKNEILKMNMNYSNIDKKIWTDTFISIMLMKT